MRLVSLNVGHPVVLVKHGRQYSTSINRRPVDGPLLLTASGLAGDRVSDDRVHGGPDKAICCYPQEHYAYFSQRLGGELSVPAFGENFTTAGLLEEHVCIGDTYRIGGAVVQVSQPRQPCAKLALKHDSPELIRWVNETAFTGFYLRVLTPGDVAAGTPFELLERPHPQVTAAALTRALHAQPRDERWLREILAVAALSAAWRRSVDRRLNPDAEAEDDA